MPLGQGFRRTTTRPGGMSRLGLAGSDRPSPTRSTCPGPLFDAPERRGCTFLAQANTFTGPRGSLTASPTWAARSPAMWTRVLAEEWSPLRANCRLPPISGRNRSPVTAQSPAAARSLVAAGSSVADQRHVAMCDGRAGRIFRHTSRSARLCTRTYPAKRVTSTRHRCRTGPDHELRKQAVNHKPRNRTTRPRQSTVRLPTTAKLRPVVGKSGPQTPDHKPQVSARRRETRRRKARRSEASRRKAPGQPGVRYSPLAGRSSPSAPNGERQLGLSSADTTATSWASALALNSTGTTPET